MTPTSRIAPAEFAVRTLGSVRWMARDYSYPLLIYVSSRVSIVVAAWALSAIQFRGHVRAPLATFLTLWDGQWYRAIMQGGYPHSMARDAGGHLQQSAIAFFPVYPALARAVMVALQVRPSTALLLVSFVCGAVSTCALWYVAHRYYGPEAADAAAYLFSFAPGALVLSLAYSEGVLVLAAIVSLALLDRRQWLLAGLVGAVAAATRPTGIAVAAAAASASLAAIRERRDYSSVMAPALASVGLVGYLGYLYALTGSWTVYWIVQRDGWGQRFDFGVGVFRDAVALVADAGNIDVWVVVLGAAGAAYGLYLVVRSQLPFSYTVYSCAVLAFCLGSANLGARPRFVFAAFPLVIAAAGELPQRALRVLVCGSAMTMVTLFFWYELGAGSVPP